MKKFRYFLFLLILPFISLLNVHADTIDAGAYTKISGYSWLPDGFWYSSLPANSSKDLKFELFSSHGDIIGYNTLIIDFCSSGFSGANKITRKYPIGQGCTNSCFGTSIQVQDLMSSSKSYEGYACSNFRAYVPISKLSVATGCTSTSCTATLEDYLTFSSVYSYNLPLTLSGIYLSDDVAYSNGGITQDSIDRVNSTISSLKDNINNTNSKLDDANSKLDEAENTRKGIWSTIKDVLSNIISLPKKIVEFLVDALKSLFIPTESQISEVIDDSKELSENFGFVGEGVSFSVQLFTSLLNISQSNGCVDFPEFSLDFSNIDSIGHNVKFWDKKSVCLADNQWFGSNSNGIVVVRSISTILLIVVFLNFCYKAFFRVLSKESGD